MCVPDDLVVDSAGDAVLQLGVKLREGVLREDRGIGHVAYKVREKRDFG